MRRPAKLAERPDMMALAKKSLSEVRMTVSADDRVGNVGRVPFAAGLSAQLRLLQATSAGRTAALVVLVAILAFLSIYPLSMLLYGSLHSTPPGAAGHFQSRRLPASALLRQAW